MRADEFIYRLDELKGTIIPIGFVGENEFTRVLFDSSDLFEKYPTAVASMTVKSPNGQIYPVVVDKLGIYIVWQVKASDLIQNGIGEVQLTFTVGTIIQKTYTAKTEIKASLVGAGPTPDPIADFVEEANKKLAAVDEATHKAEATASHPAIISETGYWEIWDPVTEQYVLTETKAQGAKGDPGSPGDPTQLIDDTTPSQEKTFSSAKIDQELAGVKTDITEIEDDVSDVKNAIQGLDDDKYEKPSGGIPATDMTQEVQDALADAESAYQKPSGGIPASDIADGVIPVVDSALSESSTNAIQNKVVKGALDGKAPVIINTATGNPAVFNDGGGMPIKSLLIPITLKQTGSGDPSPSNIRPIVPWDGLTIFHSGADTSNPTETDIVFPSPVYGGGHEVVSGKLMSFYALLTKNTAEMNNNEDYPGWKNSGVENIIGTGVNALISNVLTNVSPVSGLSVGANTAYGNDVLYLNKSYFNKTQSEWQALAIDVQILIQLETPQEIQLTPQQITALVGNNTIWSDADGSMTVEYPADTKTYINNLIATAIASL